MKGLFVACMLVALQAGPARAYEADVHYSATYVLARALGWTEAEALTIASANQAMDENQDTVAALEAETGAGQSFSSDVLSSLRQAERNLDFHCFSKSRDNGGEISADVREVISDHFARIPAHGADGARENTRRLIALGVALHCQQDAHSHVGFGGSCGAHPGNCHGHAYQTFLDQVVFGLVGKHYFNPDHPGVSGDELLDAVEATARELALHRPRHLRRFLPPQALMALARSLRTSGLELPDDTRRDCNRHLAGKWLFELGAQAGEVERLAPSIAHTCRNASLASARVVAIPEPRFPRLNADATPALVSLDGSYQVVRGGALAEAAGVIPNHGGGKLKVQLSHWSQILALPLRMRTVLASAESSRQAR